MPSMESLLRFYLLAMAQGRELFVHENRGIYLVKHPSVIELSSADPDEEDEGRTELIGLRSTDARELRAGSRDEWAAALIRKRPGYPPYNRVVVGRSRVCDVVAGYASVSKVHAHFHLENFVPVAISDQRSANGTWLGAHRLAPGDVAPIALGDRVRMGDLEFELADANGLYDLLRKHM
jgi:hypothetical protein